MQITRQRVRPVMDVNVEETCPTCGGTGKIMPSILFTDSLETKIDFLVNKLGIKRFRLYVHPFVAAYINQGIFSIKRRWQMKYGFGVKVLPNQKLAYLQYTFHNMKGEEFILNQQNVWSKHFIPFWVKINWLKSGEIKHNPHIYIPNSV